MRLLRSLCAGYCAFGFLFAALLFAQNEPAPASTVLGSGHGIDHFGIAVKDLAEAKKVFQDQLGFSFSLASQGEAAGGTVSAGINFKNHRQYLEVIAVADSSKIDAEWVRGLALFLDRFEGPIFVGLSTSSASGTAAYLRGRGLDPTPPIPSSWTPAGAKEQIPDAWKIIGFNKPPVPGNVGAMNPIFFIEYNDEVVKQSPKRNDVHANGSVGIRGVWMAVKDLDAVTDAYQRVGFTSNRQLDIPAVGAKARELQAGSGVILLLAPTKADGSVAKTLSERGESVMGISLEVSNLNKTREVLTARGQKVISTSGAFGKGLMVNAAFAKGTWMEFVEK